MCPRCERRLVERYTFSALVKARFCRAHVQTYTSDGWVAQLAEQWTENPRVGGSIPPPATPPFSEINHEGTRTFRLLSCFYTQFGELLALPLLAVLLFGLLRMRVTN